VAKAITDFRKEQNIAIEKTRAENVFEVFCPFFLRFLWKDKETVP
jgi:hypothetical protein